MDLQRRDSPEQASGTPPLSSKPKSPEAEPLHSQQHLALINFQRARTVQNEIKKLQNELEFLQQQFVLSKQVKGWKEGDPRELKFSRSDLLEAISDDVLYPRKHETWVTTRLGFCKLLLSELMNHPLAKNFINSGESENQMDEEQAFPFLRRPSTLGVVLENLEAGKYSSEEAFATDVRSVWAHTLFTNESGSDIFQLAEKMSNLFEMCFSKLFTEQIPVRQLVRLCEKELGLPKIEERLAPELSQYLQNDLYNFLRGITPCQRQEVLYIIHQEMPHILQNVEERFTLDFSRFDPVLLFRLHLYAQTSKQQNRFIDEMARCTLPTSSVEEPEIEKKKPGLTSSVNLNVVTMTNLNLSDMANMTKLPMIYPSGLGTLPGAIENEPPAPPKKQKADLTISVSKRGNSQAMRSPKSRSYHDPTWTGPGSSPRMSPHEHGTWSGHSTPSEPNWSSHTSPMPSPHSEPYSRGPGSAGPDWARSPHTVDPNWAQPGAPASSSRRTSQGTTYMSASEPNWVQRPSPHISPRFPADPNWNQPSIYISNEGGSGYQNNEQQQGHQVYPQQMSHQGHYVQQSFSSPATSPMVSPMVSPSTRHIPSDPWAQGIPTQQQVMMQPQGQGMSTQQQGMMQGQGQGMVNTPQGMVPQQQYGAQWQHPSQQQMMSPPWAQQNPTYGQQQGQGMMQPPQGYQRSSISRSAPQTPVTPQTPQHLFPSQLSTLPGESDEQNLSRTWDSLAIDSPGGWSDSLEMMQRSPQERWTS